MAKKTEFNPTKLMEIPTQSKIGKLVNVTKYKCSEGTKIGEKITDSYGEKRNLAYDSGKIFYSSEKEKEEEFGKEKDGIFSIEIGEKKVKTELNYFCTHLSTYFCSDS